MWISWIIIQIPSLSRLSLRVIRFNYKRVTTWLNVYIYDNDCIMQHRNNFELTVILWVILLKLWCDSFPWTNALVEWVNYTGGLMNLIWISDAIGEDWRLTEVPMAFPATRSVETNFYYFGNSQFILKIRQLSSFLHKNEDKQLLCGLRRLFVGEFINKQSSFNWNLRWSCNKQKPIFCIMAIFCRREGRVALRLKKSSTDIEDPNTRFSMSIYGDLRRELIRWKNLRNVLRLIKVITPFN